MANTLLASKESNLWVALEEAGHAPLVEAMKQLVERQTACAPT